ncbi:MAG: hypothetical protein ABEJ68_02320 [Halobacteriaceae archaeon]
MADPGDHVRPAGEDREHGVYRVVGTGETVALLRVADADGRRVHSGELRHVERPVLEREFERAPDPDAGFDPVQRLENALSGLYWQFRRFL